MLRKAQKDQIYSLMAEWLSPVTGTTSESSAYASAIEQLMPILELDESELQYHLKYSDIDRLCKKYNRDFDEQCEELVYAAVRMDAVDHWGYEALLTTPDFDAVLSALEKHKL